jgi:hypothetical protein
MNNDYLNRVMFFLKREMPDLGQHITLKENKLIFTVPVDTPFQTFYEAVFRKVADCTKKRKREEDIPFCVWSPAQERDFMILKQ